LIKEWNNGNPQAIFNALSPDVVIVDETGKQFGKKEYVRLFKKVYLPSMPDYHLVIEDVITKGDQLVVRYTESGTMKGDLMGIPATGKSFSAPAMEIWRFSDGEVIELRMARDILTALTQFGVIPPFEPPPE
jgi:steroid delta-isomerase-like uncharacterized protein